MAPLPAVPPPPPAIHAPIPVQQVAAAAQMNPSQTIRSENRAPGNTFPSSAAHKFHHFRHEHIKHWKGARSNSIKQRTGKGKASRKAKLKRRRK